MKTKNQGWGIPVPGKVANTEVPNPPKDATGETRRGCLNTCEWEIGMKRTEVALACCTPFSSPCCLGIFTMVFYLVFSPRYFYYGAGKSGGQGRITTRKPWDLMKSAWDILLPPTPWPGSYRRQWQPHSHMKSSVSHRGMGRFWSCQVHLPRAGGQAELKVHHHRLSASPLWKAPSPHLSLPGGAQALTKVSLLPPPIEKWRSRLLINPRK